MSPVFWIDQKKRPADAGLAQLRHLFMPGTEVKLFADHVRKTVRQVRCPVHGESPRIVCKGRSLKDLEVEVYGCCDELTDAVKAKF